jgi:hypothetical protein
MIRLFGTEQREQKSDDDDEEEEIDLSKELSETTRPSGKASRAETHP